MSESYYIRSRGRVSGPFNVAALQKLARRGMLSRAHELSSDRQSWSSAADAEQLFTQSASPTSAALAKRTAAEGPSTDSFYYVLAGQTIGPVSLAVLISLSRAGTIQPNDLVWSGGRQTAEVAGQIPALSDLFSTTTLHSVAASANPAAPRGLPSGAQSIGTSPALWGAVVGVICLLTASASFYAVYNQSPSRPPSPSLSLSSSPHSAESLSPSSNVGSNDPVMRSPGYQLPKIEIIDAQNRGPAQSVQVSDWRANGVGIKGTLVWTSGSVDTISYTVRENGLVKDHSTLTIPGGTLQRGEPVEVSIPLSTPNHGDVVTIEVAE